MKQSNPSAMCNSTPPFIKISRTTGCDEAARAVGATVSVPGLASAMPSGPVEIQPIALIVEIGGAVS